ncbi:hypothetical protein A6U87_06070 [Rhizobium sp. AC44/96]|uniref:Ig domain-containing protein n=1 Tax=Rhizobium sp. AC44/96 TaxID=1841654 RepID=UPI00080FAC9B|nr:Ig domain-containing protein [Rhizobium sp. AC44/96]OCJ12873.1 hypothetical protein A6U87_06070 [Rhizobium sp. AC44/96]
MLMSLVALLSRFIRPSPAHRQGTRSQFAIYGMGRGVPPRLLLAFLIIVGFGTGRALALDVLERTFPVGEAISRPYLNASAGSGVLYIDSIGGSIPGTTLSAFDSAGQLYLSVQGTPTQIGTYTVSVAYHYFENVRTCDPDIPDLCWTDAVRHDQSKTFTIKIEQATLTISPATIREVAEGAALDITLSATGGGGAYSYSVTEGTLPPGVTLSPAGEFLGATTTDGSYTFTVTATDSYGSTGVRRGCGDQHRRQLHWSRDFTFHFGSVEFGPHLGSAELWHAHH